MRSQRTLAPLKASELLIVAAHSDDCVIMGAEMAWEILQEGGKVRIAYLTCSGPDPEAKISQVRVAEAHAAWHQIHNENVHIISADLPQSPVAGPPSYDEAALDRFRRLLVRNMNEMQEGAIVLLTAPLESHVDHNNARIAGINALETVDRDDFRVFETPEYNNLLSMRHDPVGVILTWLNQLPLLHRILPERSTSPVFLGGEIGSVFSDSSERLRTKIDMLSTFASQDPNLLKEYFTWPSRYRLLDKKPYPNAFQVMGRTADLSVIVFLILLYLSISILAISLSKEHQISAIINSAIGISFIFFGLRKNRQVPAILGGSLLLGAIIGISI
jgi:LmbE family N-acetylglucosaminyl deacetylase